MFVVSLRLSHLARVVRQPWLALALCTGAGAAASPHPPLQSPHYREAQYYRHQAQSLFALASLLAAQKQGLLDAERNTVELLLGQLYREHELPGQAADSLQRASGVGVGSLRGRAWWELAVQRYQHGDYRRADDAIKRTTGLLPYELEQRRPLLQAQILIGMNRNAEAAALLGAWQPIQEQEPYTRYNVGVAMVRAGDLLQGAGMLDSVGTMPAPSAELLALRDQANLAMGYGFLRADHGATARPMFKRVRLEGPFSSLALLGAGWAELAPDGNRQQNLYLSPVGCVEDPARVLPESLLILRRPPREACDRERTFKTRVFFEQAPGADAEAERLRRALVPWQTLIARIPADPAVQEAMLAVPYAYTRLKGREQAVEHYRSAITQYEAERRQLQQIAHLIRETSLPPVPRQDNEERLPAWALPRPQDSLYLGPLFASHPFQAGLGDLRKLRELTRALTTLDTRLTRLAPPLDGGHTQAFEAGEARSPLDTPGGETADRQEPPAEDELPDPPGASRRITYFGVFDFLPPEEIPTGAAAAGAGADTTPVDAEGRADGAVPDAAMPRNPEPRARGGRSAEQHQQLRMRLDRLQAQVQTAQDAQENQLREMALTELAQQQARLDTYLAQARFSLARLLDPTVASQTGD